MNCVVSSRHSAKAATAKLNPFPSNTQPAASTPEPSAEINSPPIAGPMSCATLNDAELSPTALGSNRFDTRSATNACRSGASIAVAHPNQRISANRHPDVNVEVTARTPIVRLGIAMCAWETNSAERLFHRSAMMPPGYDSTSAGRNWAVAARPTASALPVSCHTNQSCATRCIHVPTLDTIAPPA